ncbi:hypothetical protein FQN50_003356 [Emmonsiellopsis sp. PD_5]|nr:hypothetical protein FQN50_003356 [Emmonsiellopsis sp. PD_5]
MSHPKEQMYEDSGPTSRLGRPKSLQLFHSPTHRRASVDAKEESKINHRRSATVHTYTYEPSQVACGSPQAHLVEPGHATLDIDYRWSGQNITPPGSVSPPSHYTPHFCYGGSASYGPQWTTDTPESHASHSSSEESVHYRMKGHLDGIIYPSETQVLPSLYNGFENQQSCGDFLPNEFLDPIPTSNVFDNSLASSPDTGYASTSEADSHVYKLSNLHEELHSLFMSPKSSDTTCLEDSITSPEAFTVIKPSAEINQIFVATESLIELIEKSYQDPMITSYQADTSPTNTPQSSPQRKASAISATSGISSNEADPSTVFLTLTCYLRLLDIYEPLVISIYQYLQQRQQQQQSTPVIPFPFPLSSFPTFKLGSFGLEANSTLNLGLLIHLLLKTMERTRDTIRQYIPTTSISDSSRWAYDAAALPDYGPQYVPIEGQGSAYNGMSQSSSDPVMLRAEAALAEAGKRERYLMGLLYTAKEAFML